MNASPINAQAAHPNPHRTPGGHVVYFAEHAQGPVLPAHVARSREPTPVGCDRVALFVPRAVEAGTWARGADGAIAFRARDAQQTRAHLRLPTAMFAPLHDLSELAVRLGGPVVRGGTRLAQAALDLLIVGFMAGACAFAAGTVIYGCVAVGTLLLSVGDVIVVAAALVCMATKLGLMLRAHHTQR